MHFVEPYAYRHIRKTTKINMKGSDRDVNGMMDIERIPPSSVSYMIVNSELTFQVEGEEKEGANPIHMHRHRKNSIFFFPQILLLIKIFTIFQCCRYTAQIFRFY